MRYAIVINLDYENHPQDIISPLFQAIRSSMLDAGFRQVGRIFTLQSSADIACSSARQIVTEILREHGLDQDTHHYIKEFYGFEYSQATNLLAPSTDEIKVEELSSESIKALSKAGAIKNLS
jgi:hypothetical protein